jgi:uncharacterized RDD family membrane protein YckC
VQSPAIGNPAQIEVVYAGMGRRFLAFVADCVIFVLIALVLGGILLVSGRPLREEVGRLIVTLWLIYMVTALYFTRTTIGKYLLGMEVRSSRPGQDVPALWELAMRETVFRWLSFLLFMGYIPAFTDVRHRTWSDRWANTVVVRRIGKPSRWIMSLFALTTIGLVLFVALAYLAR